MLRRRRGQDEASSETPAAEVTPTNTTRTSKKKGIPKIAVVLLLVVVVLGGGYFGMKKFVLKPKPAETVTAAAATSPSPGVDAGEASAPTAPAATAPKPDDGSKAGTVVRAGMYKCGVNRSHIFMVAFPEGEKEVRLAGVDSFHFGPITQEANNRADVLMRGKRVTVEAVSEDYFKIEGVATLADGRDMAEVLAGVGLVQQAEGATDAVKKACDVARDARKGIYALLKS